MRSSRPELGHRTGCSGATCGCGDSTTSVSNSTRTLPIEERAALAARAWIRHRFTDYEDRLDSLYGDDLLLDELEYRDIKSVANRHVDEFIQSHRTS